MPNKAGSSYAELTQQTAGFVVARKAIQELQKQLGDTEKALAGKTKKLRLANDVAGRSIESQPNSLAEI